jgi:endo-1,4-beta-xylanase
MTESGYAATAAREFSLITPENELKWDALEPIAGQFSFEAADELVRFAEKNGMKVRGHTLVWHSQLPTWVTELTDADSVRAAMRRHIQTVMGHYRDRFPGRVFAWDVVNEALDHVRDEAGNVSIRYRNSPFFTSLGEGFIAEAFRIAHEVDPSALLYYNDYGIEGMGLKATTTFEMLRGLVEQGVPIHGVGFQMHTNATDEGPKLEDFQANLARYATINLPVNISEMDVSICRASGSWADRLTLQRHRINAVAGACLRSSNCTSITVWGVADYNSWLNDYTPCEAQSVEGKALVPSPLLFDNSYQRKPAWAGLWDALIGCYY